MKRYDIEGCGDFCEATMEEDMEGDYVTYAGHKAVVETLDNRITDLRSTIEEFKKLLSSNTDAYLEQQNKIEELENCICRLRGNK